MWELAQLRVLVEVARTGSYSAAGRSLGFTQPAISYQVRALEREVGAPVALRVGRSMRLTPVGEALVEHAERILAGVRSAEAELASLVRAPSRVRLAAFPSSCATVVPRTMSQLRRTHPDLGVDLRQAEPPEAREMLRRGTVDVAVTYRFTDTATATANAGRTPAAGMHRRTALVERMHLIVPFDHPTAATGRVRLEQLRDDTFLVASTDFVERLEVAGRVAGFSPRVTWVADDYVVMQSLVGAGFGVAFVPRLALDAHSDPRVVPRQLEGWPDREVLVEVWADSLRVAPVRQLVEELMRSAAAGPRPPH